MPVDKDTRRKIVELYLNEHKTIRDIAKVSKKSSRDIVAVLRNSEHYGNAEENKNIHENNIPAPTRKETGDTEHDLPPNIKAYKLLSEEKSIVQITIELNLTAQQAQQFNTEYWKLMQMDHLFMIYQEVKNNLGYFLKLFRLGKKEGLTPENIISLLNMANNLQDLNVQFQFHLSEVSDIELKKSQCREQLEKLENMTISAKDQLSDTERACKQKFAELSGICSQVQMLEYQIERYKNTERYLTIEQAAKERVNDLLTDNRKVLEYALASVIDALRNDPDRYLLIDKIPVADIINHNSLGTIQSTFYQGDYQFVKEKVMEIADNLFGRLQKGLVYSALSSLLTIDRKREIYPI